MNIIYFFKYLYNIFPFKKELYSVFRNLKLPEKIYKHLHFKGFFKVKVNEELNFIMYHPGTVEENEIFWNGLFNAWEKKSIYLWSKLVKKSEVIFDIGANTGLYSLVANSINDKASIYSFEPLPEVFNILNKNINKNQFIINSYNIGLSNFNGKARVYLPEDSEFAYSVTINKNTIPDIPSKEIFIDVMRLDSFIEMNIIKKIDLIKIDVETHEIEVLQGMGEYLKLFKPTIIIEVLNNEIAEKLNDIFYDYNYLYFNINDANNTIRKVELIEKSDHWNFLICSNEVAKYLKLI